MAGDTAAYTRKEFEDALVQVMAEGIMAPGVSPSEHPRAFLLGGQSGAGKTTLHAILSRELGHDVVIVNGDAYRSLHPRFHQLQEAYGDDSVAYTAPWAGKMTEALVDRLSRLGYNLVVEGTLRTAEVPLATATLLRGRGYGVSLALMAVKPEISLLSCQLRYEKMRLQGTVPRATDPAHHLKIVEQIVGNLAVLEASGLFDGVGLFDRMGRRLYPDGGTDGTASEALDRVLFGPWTDEEGEHRAYLEQQLEELRAR